MVKRGLALLLLLGFGLLSLLSAPAQAAQSNNAVAMAYVLNNSVWLADFEGNPLINTGPEIDPRQGARLFWSPDGQSLYIATRAGLYITSAEGGAAVRLPGEFGLTVRPARHGGVLYNIDTDNPQAISETLTSFPLRETNVANAGGGRGRLVTYIGEYQTASTQVNVTHAAALYARDGGLLEGGRPQLWATYGGALFYSCCYPNPGLALLDLGVGEGVIYDAEFIPGPAAANATASRLAGPTINGQMRLIDLISAGTRDYTITTAGVVERIAWSADDSAIYYVTRENPFQALAVNPTVTYPADVRSASAVIWQLDLISGRINRVAVLGDVFGVSSLAVNGDYIFATVVQRNERLVNALNSGELPPDVDPADPRLNDYIPRTVLMRINISTSALYAVNENAWGVSVRPR